MNHTTTVAGGITPDRPLTVFEAAWLSLFVNSEYPAVTLSIVMFVIHEIVYFGRFVPYWIMDYIPFFQQYKIQGTQVSSDEFWKVTLHALKSQFFVQLPMMLGFYSTSLLIGVSITEVPFPSLATLAGQQVWFMLVEDTYHYWAHRAMHHGWLYKNIHKQHHEFQAPFGITAEYAHTLEVLMLGLGFFLGPATWALSTRGTEHRLHIVSMIVWMAVRLILTVDDHSGYDFPWSLHHWVPFFGGADFHDYHHMAFIGNYSSTFRHWDWICGTDAGYRAHSVKLRATRKAKRAAAAASARLEAREKLTAHLGKDAEAVLSKKRV